MGCPGIYTLDCYCDNVDDVLADGRHSFREFPHQFTAELGSTCRKNARKRGWRIDYERNVFLCPKCNPRSPRFIPLTTPKGDDHV